ncbi:MAG: hypothetical protein QOG15_2966 [Solirubrobacteraceae bacterium]|jgi:hypothetical protein|nr:hypothetical protein [Solirubrobacteraceae bacterium]
MTTRRFGLIAALALSALFVAIAPSAALAKSRDRNHDKIPDRWEKKNHLSLKVKQTTKDQDHDGLRNLQEFRNHTNPRDADSDNDGLGDGAEVDSENNPTDDDTDNDGVMDGEENAGTIASFDGTTLTISLGGGGSISAMVVDGFTEVKCETASTVSSRHDGGGDSSDDNSGPGSSSSGSGDGGSSGDDNADNNGGDNETDCGIAALQVGATVHEAELELVNGMAVFHEVKLVAGP